MALVTRLKTPAILDPAIVTGIRLPGTLNTDLAGYWEHQDTIDRARRNLATGLLCAVIGSPIVASNGVTFTGNSAYIDTGLSPTAALTLVQVTSLPNAVGTSGTGQVPLIGNFGGSASSTSMWVEGRGSGTPASPAGQMRGAASFSSGLASATVTETNSLAWACRALRTADALGTRLDNLTTGGGTTTANANPRVVGTSTLRIGSFYSSYTGLAKALRTVVWFRRLSDTELAAAHTFLAAQVSGLGVTV